MEKQGFHLVSPYQPTGDQPEAIDKLVEGIQKEIGNRRCWALPVPAKNVHHGQYHCAVESSDAGACTQQDAGGAAVFGIPGVFSENAVEYFVSYYDYYQPEAYIASTDTYIEKIPRSMMRSTSFATPQRRRCRNAEMSSSARASRVFTASAIPSTIGPW